MVPVTCPGLVDWGTTTTPAGKALFQMMGVFAEFERTMIQERVHAGLARARKEGKRLGRPRVEPGDREGHPKSPQARQGHEQDRGRAWRRELDRPPGNRRKREVTEHTCPPDQARAATGAV